MIYGYARCSTNEEMQDINRQIRELKQLGATDETIYREYESGMKNDRVELNRFVYPAPKTAAARGLNRTLAARGTAPPPLF